jgi:hypothetical protein
MRLFEELIIPHLHRIEDASVMNLRVDHISHLVNQLDTRGIQRFNLKYLTLHGIRGATIVGGIDAPITATFPELEFLTLVGCAASWFLPSLANFPKLRTLRLRYICDNIETIRDLLAGCSHLRKLIVSTGNYLLNCPSPSPQNALRSDSLESLEVEGFALDDLLLQYSHFPRVKHLKMLGEVRLLYCVYPGPSLPNLKTMEMVKSPRWDLTLLFSMM